jgi:hypothetical protein
LVATLCAGVWTVLTQFSDLKKALAKEATQQEQMKLDQEREKTTRAQLAQNQSQAENALQVLKTEEQQSRERVSHEEIEEKEAELKRAMQADKIASQARNDVSFATAIGSVVALDEKPDSDAGLASLLLYVNDDRYRPEIAAALTAKAGRLKTIEQAQLWLRVTKSIVPADPDLLVSANRTARGRAERSAVAEFWALYSDHIREMPPSTYLLEMIDRHTLPFVTPHSFAGEEIDHEISKYFPKGAPQTIETISKQLPNILKDVSKDALSAQIYTLVMEQTGDLIVKYVDALPKSAHLDVSNCYLPRFSTHAFEGKNIYVPDHNP